MRQQQSAEGQGDGTILGDAPRHGRQPALKGAMNRMKTKLPSSSKVFVSILDSHNIASTEPTTVSKVMQKNMMRYWIAKKGFFNRAKQKKAPCYPLLSAEKEALLAVPYRILFFCMYFLTVLGLREAILWLSSMPTEEQQTILEVRTFSGTQIVHFYKT